jgi:hypothetical protein
MGVSSGGLQIFWNLKIKGTTKKKHEEQHNLFKSQNV